ncbi:MAG: recombinase family protein [Defluviitaleaceae bacterium]|nr:recombinase family protein [Defluviitaleaceae bacterium]
MITYGYARCSTNETMQDIDRQKKELKALGVDSQNIFCEYESGSKTNRVELNRLLETVKSGDTIITTEVSRLTRNTKQLCEIIEFVNDRNLKLVIGNLFSVDCTKNDTDPLAKAMNRGMLMMMGIFADLERALICQRVRSGMENAREKGAVIGRPQTTVANLPKKFIEFYPKYVAKDMTQEDLAAVCKVTRQSIAKYIRIYKDATT